MAARRGGRRDRAYEAPGPAFAVSLAAIPAEATPELSLGRFTAYAGTIITPTSRRTRIITPASSADRFLIRLLEGRPINPIISGRSAALTPKPPTDGLAGIGPGRVGCRRACSLSAAAQAENGVITAKSSQTRAMMKIARAPWPQLDQSHPHQKWPGKEDKYGNGPVTNSPGSARPFGEPRRQRKEERCEEEEVHDAPEYIEPDHRRAP